MNCKHVDSLLSRYMDEELTAPLQAQVHAHLHGNAQCKPCAACNAGLIAMQRAVSLLQADAKNALPHSPDLYVRFQERLVTQPRGGSRQARRTAYVRALRPVLGFALGGLIVSGGVYYRNHRYDDALNEMAEALHQSSSDPAYLRETEQRQEPDGRVGSAIWETWLEKRARYFRMQSQNSPALPNQKTAVSDYTILQGYTLPSGIGFQWNRGKESERPVQLNWSHIDPSDPQQAYNAINVTKENIFSDLLHLTAIDGAAAKADIHFATRRINNETMRELTVNNLARALQPSGPQPYDMTPDTLCLWFDALNRLRRYRQEYHDRAYYGGATKATWNREGWIEYGQPIPAAAHQPNRLDLPVLPNDGQVVVRHTPLMLRNGQRKAEDFAVKPVWFTMSPQEKRQIQDTTERFAQAWGKRDTDALRSLVDVDWPLQITRPGRRNGLTGAQVWQRAWETALAQEPKWRQYHAEAVFAYEGANRPLDVVPLHIDPSNADAALPGLNVLVWVRAQRESDPRNMYPHPGFAAYLYLVKREGRWKAFQYCPLTSTVRFISNSP